MTLRCYDIIQEPAGSDLQQLVTTLAPFASELLLVLRDEIGLDNDGSSLLSSLTPHIVNRRRSATWPGTELIGEEATIIQFSLTGEVLNALMSASPGLYGWQQPKLPEDPALLRKNGTVLLGSICHEHDAFLEVTDDEYEEIARAFPDIIRLIRLHS